MRCLLAVDSGGTKCEAVLVDESGRILGSGRRDHRHRPGARFLGGLGRAEEVVAEAVEEALRLAPRAEAVHIAGRRVAHDQIQHMTANVAHHVVREQDAPMALVGVSHGIVVLSGTGAFCYGRALDGSELLLDGIGPLYGDHGGAFQIGLAAVRASGRADWSKRFTTSLRDKIPAACSQLAGEPDPFNMVLYMLEARDRSEIASLAKLVGEEAEAGDAIARQILVNAADDMVETVRCVVERLDLGCAELPLIGSGSVAIQSGTYWNRIKERISEFAPNLQPIRAVHPSVFGLILAMAAQLGLDNNAFRSRLLGSDCKWGAG